MTIGVAPLTSAQQRFIGLLCASRAWPHAEFDADVPVDLLARQRSPPP